MNTRITWIIPPAPKDWGYHNPNNRSYKFKITFKTYGGNYKYYGGKRTLQSKNEIIKDGYIGSLGKNALKDKTIKLAKEFKELYATSEEVVIEILEYGNKQDIGYGECKMLREANNGDGAAASEDWFNSTNGGGEDSQGYARLADMLPIFDKVKKQIKLMKTLRTQFPKLTEGSDFSEQLKLMKQKLDETEQDLFDVSFNDTETLRGLIDLTNQIHNSREQPFVTEAHETYEANFNKDPNPSLWEPCVNLVDKNSKPLHTPSGMNRSRGNVDSTKGVGLYSIDLPWEVWNNWPAHIIKRFGSKFNPRLKKGRALQRIEDAAADVVSFCRGEKMYIKSKDENGKTNKVLNVRHKSSIVYLRDEQYWPPNFIIKILELAEKLAEEAALVDDNIIVWSKTNLKKGSQLQISFDEKVKELMKENDYKWVYKYSVSSSPPEEKLAKVIMESNYGKKGLLLPYAKSSERRKRWFNAVPISTGSNTFVQKQFDNGNNEYEDEMRVAKHITNEDCEFFNKYEIDLIFMPVLRSEAIKDGWIKPNEKNDGDS